MSSFKEDRIENEKEDPTEGSTLKYINIPLILLAMLLGFGVSYLALRTDKVTMRVGDSRTPITSPTTESNADAQDGTAELSAVIEKGKQIFTTTCQACHQASGAGIPGVFPPLGASEWVTGSPKRLVSILLHGIQGDITVKGEKFNSVMPPFKDQLSVDDIAAVSTYIRQSFGNTAEPIISAVVSETLEETKSRTTSWAGEAELNSHKWD